MHDDCAVDVHHARTAARADWMIWNCFHLHDDPQRLCVGVAVVLGDYEKMLNSSADCLHSAVYSACVTACTVHG